jgi:hypothetical protein
MDTMPMFGISNVSSHVCPGLLLVFLLVWGKAIPMSHQPAKHLHLVPLLRAYIH